VEVASRSIVRFWRNSSTSTGNYEYPSVICSSSVQSSLQQIVFCPSWYSGNFLNFVTRVLLGRCPFEFRPRHPLSCWRVFVDFAVSQTGAVPRSRQWFLLYLFFPIH
jgi:hypothetical protein